MDDTGMSMNQPLDNQDTNIDSEIQTMAQQGLNYKNKQTNHLGFQKDMDLFGIKDLKKLQFGKKSKKKKTKNRIPITQQDLSKLTKYLILDNKQKIKNVI